jgi:alpha 1,3-glucosidase
MSKRNQAALYFDLLNDQTQITQLNVKLSIIEDGGIIRIQVDEHGEKRYSIPAGDVVSADLRYYGGNIVVVNPPKDGEFTVLFEDFALTIDYEPFKILMAKNGKIQVLLNHYSLFHVESKGDNQNVESVRETSSSTSDDNYSDDFTWDEKKSGRNENEDIDKSFNGFSDSMPKGRQSLSSDIIFPQCQSLYGLPEHTTGLQLIETMKIVGGNFTTPNEPYRLYNLDVFEYELDSTVALYGSMPFVLGYKENAAVGVFWNNPSETWVDIGSYVEGDGKWGHFMSESGQIDLFLFAAETPKEILSKLAQVSGFPSLPPMFALGYHQCRWNYNSEKDLLNVNENFDRHGIPMDVLWLDIEHTNGKRYFTWDQREFPEPLEMQKELERTQRHLVNIVDPHIKVDDGYSVFNELRSKGFAVLDKFKQMFQGNCWPGTLPIIIMCAKLF